MAKKKTPESILRQSIPVDFCKDMRCTRFREHTTGVMAKYENSIPDMVERCGNNCLYSAMDYISWQKKTRGKKSK